MPNPDGSIATCSCPNRHLNHENARFCKSCGNSLLVLALEGPKNSWRAILPLEKDEEIVDYWFGDEKEEEEEMKLGESINQADEHFPGLIVLTDRQFILLEREPSFGENGYRIRLQLPLSRISDVSYGRVPDLYVSVTEAEGFHVFGLYEPVSGLFASSSLRTLPEHGYASFQETILHCRDQRRLKLLEIEKKERVQVILDFSFLKNYLEKGGMIVQKISCANCGASMHLPEKGNTVDCPYCKTTHRIEDIFDRINQLID